MRGPRSIGIVVALFLLATLPSVASSLAPTPTRFHVSSHVVGLVWTGHEFIASYRDGTTKLLRASGNGSTIEPFAPAFTGQGEVYIALSAGEAGFPSGYLYMSSGGSVYQADPQGKTVKSFSNVSKSTLEFIAFDETGAWGHDLLALSASGEVWTIDSRGLPNLVTSLGDNLVPEGITVAPSTFGSYGGNLIVSLEARHSVIAISHDNPLANRTLATIPGEAPERVLVIPAGEALYVAKYDDGSVVGFGAGNFSSVVGSILMITEGESGQTGSLTVLTAAGNNVTASRIFEDHTSPHFEGAAFASSFSVTTSASSSVAGGGLSGLLYPGVLLTAGVALVIGLIALRVRNRSAKTS
ncbi:MAG: hypothetical protein OK422_05595 [Thaumarchaeota archaeon]|nr:hypothetical protein [Nitrososphaerota archaeon]